MFGTRVWKLKVSPSQFTCIMFSLPLSLYQIFKPCHINNFLHSVFLSIHTYIHIFILIKKNQRNKFVEIKNKTIVLQHPVSVPSNLAKSCEALQAGTAAQGHRYVETRTRPRPSPAASRRQDARVQRAPPRTS